MILRHRATVFVNRSLYTVASGAHTAIYNLIPMLVGARAQFRAVPNI